MSFSHQFTIDSLTNYILCCKHIYENKCKNFKEKNQKLDSDNLWVLCYGQFQCFLYIILYVLNFLWCACIILIIKYFKNYDCYRIKYNITCTYVVYFGEYKFSNGKTYHLSWVEVFPLIIFQVEVSKMILNMWWISGFLCVLLTRWLSEQVQEMIWFVFL